MTIATKDAEELMHKAEQLRQLAKSVQQGEAYMAVLAGADALEAQAEVLRKKEERLAEKEGEEGEGNGKKHWMLIVNEDVSAGWAIQTSEDITPDEVKESLIPEFKTQFNLHTRKGKKAPASTIAELFADIPRAMTVESGFWIKTKEPVAVIKMNNRI